MSDLAELKLWANSGDSHITEPPDLFDSLPDDIKERMPRSVRNEEGTIETIYIDGQEFIRSFRSRNPVRSPAGPRSTPARRTPMTTRICSVSSRPTTRPIASTT